MSELLLLQEVGVAEYPLQYIGALTSESALGMFRGIENHRYVVWV